MRRAFATRFLLCRDFCRMTLPPLMSRRGTSSNQEAKRSSLGEDALRSARRWSTQGPVLHAFSTAAPLSELKQVFERLQRRLPSFFLAGPRQNAVQLLQQNVLVLFNLPVSARPAFRRRNFFILEPEQREGLKKFRR